MKNVECSQCHRHPTRCLCIAEQLQEGFARIVTEADWEISVEPCDFDEHLNIHAAYLVTLVAKRDLNGMNKQGAYEKAEKGTVVQYEVYIHKDGKVIPMRMILPGKRKED